VHLSRDPSSLGRAGLVPGSVGLLVERAHELASRAYEESPAEHDGGTQQAGPDIDPVAAAGRYSSGFTKAQPTVRPAMMARSRPQARIAALKVAARIAPEAVRITSETAPTPIPTADGWARRQCSETSVASPTRMATTRNHGGCSCHVSARVAALIANATRYIVASTTRSRCPRASAGASITTPGSAERIQPDIRRVNPAVAWRAIARG